MKHGLPSVSWLQLHDPADPQTAQLIADFRDQMQQMVQDALVYGFSGNAMLEPPKPKHPREVVPYEGVRATEVIGWRAWWVQRKTLTLRSLVNNNQVWHPGKIVGGKVDEVVDHGGMSKPIYGGVYIFRDLDQVRMEFHDVERMLPYRLDIRQEWTFPTNFNPYDLNEPVQPDVAYEDPYADAICFGTVKLWGEVYEHEHGYRAQFAKINSLEAVIEDPKYRSSGRARLAALRERYKV